jgi:class 3 adenylate cyclase/predicted ATPase
MRCPSCNAENQPTAKFCIECGTAFPIPCVKCGLRNPPSAKFCQECGAPLKPGDGPQQFRGSPSPASREIAVANQEPSLKPNEIPGERKTVTALFADIKGSMELMENLDPEEARAIVDPALKLMIDTVHRYDGYIVQSTGDGVFALFGAPVAHEDHPQRALYAALRMQEDLKRYSNRLHIEGNLPLQARLGINTGEVVVRSIQTESGRDEYTPIGHPSGLAARMQALAPVGSIAATDATRKLCEGYFTFKSLGPMLVKGVNEPLEVYEVTGLGPIRTRFQRAAARGLTKFVGRMREMETLEHAAELARAGHGQIVAVIAEPGVGKSRLLFEFKATLRTGWMVLETFSVSGNRDLAYLPVIGLLRNYFRIARDDDKRSLREKVSARIVALDRNLEDTLPYLFALLSIVDGDDPLAQMDGKIKKERTLEAIKRIIMRESLNQPLLMIFEDLHWTDVESEELLNLLADGIANARILLLVNYRPEYRHNWGSKTYYLQLRLDPLGLESAEEMLDALLSVPATSCSEPDSHSAAGESEDSDLVPLKHLIIEKTDGNPFFIEEMVQNLFEQGALVRNGSPKLARPLSAIQVPPTVQAMIAARIDRLPAHEKELLQTAAVLGKEFRLNHLKAIIETGDPEMELALANLQLAEFIYEQPATGDIEYVFKHALTRDVAYGSILVERRRVLHEKAAQAIEHIHRHRLEDHYSELVHHYGRSRNSEKALEYLWLAGQQAVRRFANAEALTHLSAAIELLQALPDTPERASHELRLQVALGVPLGAIKGHAAPEVGAVYSRARELCRRVGETPQLFPVLSGLRLFYHARADFEPARELGEQLLSLAQRLDDPTLIVRAHRMLGDTLFWQGELTSARTHMEQAIALYEPQQHRSQISFYGYDAGVFGLFHAGLVLWFLGYPDQALKRTYEALALAQELVHTYSIASALAFAALLHQYRREVPLAQEQADSCIALSTERGFAYWLVWGTLLKGRMLVAHGQPEDGIVRMHQSLDAYQRMGAGVGRCTFLALLAQAYGEAGQTEQGLRVLDEALDLVNETGEYNSAAELYRVQGELLLTRNDINAAKAENCFQRAIEVAQQQHAKSLELRATTNLARLLAQRGHRDEARYMLAEIYGWFTEGFDTADLKDAKALLEQFGG